jgi:hypothetical protein
MEQLRGLTAILLLAVTFISLFLVAANEVRKKRRAKRDAKKPPTSDIPAQPPLTISSNTHCIAVGAAAFEERPL